MKTRVLHESVDYGVATRIVVCVDYPHPRQDNSWRIYMDFYPGEGLLKIAGKLSILAGEVAKKALFPAIPKGRKKTI